MEANSIDGAYAHWLPSLSFDYSMKGNKDAKASYTTSITAPKLEQLLPLPDNTNPNFNYIGNPNLIPEYTHSMLFSFNLFDNFNLTSLFSNIRFTISENKIVNKTDIDNQLFRSVTPINTDNYKDVQIYLSFNRPFRPLKINYSIRTQLNYSNYNSFLNKMSSPVSDSNMDIKFFVQNRKTEYVYVEAGVRWNRSHRNYEIDTDFNQSYDNLDYYLDTEFYLPHGITIGSEIHYNKYSSDGFIDNPQYYLWSATLSKLFLDNKIELRLSAHDILNQNIGYRRYGSATSISEDRYDNLGQYFIVGINYKIGKGKRDDGISIQIDN